jgi:hypothetical protein
MTTTQAEQKTYSLNPPTIEEMHDILMLIRSLERGATIQRMQRYINDAKYILQDAIERPAVERPL